MQRSTSLLKNLPSSLSLPLGFKASGVHCGIKKDISKPDISLIVSSLPCVASAVVTQNQFSAAPVVVTKQVLSKNNNNIYGLVVNSGCANAVTGEQGLKDSWEMVELTNELIGKQKDSVLVMSTGVIGHTLPMDKVKKGIKEGIEKLGEDEDSYHKCSQGFMTTDAFPKIQSYQNKVKEKGMDYSILGICKGAGMIHPNMATLLTALITDVNISETCLKDALKYATDKSFNSISIDGDTSTNDCCIVLANGGKKNEIINNLESEEYKKFKLNLTEIMIQLAKLIVLDGEGATKFLSIHVKNSRNELEAKQIANSIATSALVKTAFYGEDANWGRIIAAVGYSGVKINTEKIDLKINVGQKESDDKNQCIYLLKNGKPIVMDEVKAKEIMKNKELFLSIDLNLGDKDATIWTCDFSHEYVTINGSYRT
ncbi:bifunctional ornithine acetyltransferase/N-acetylglutamate synthase protein [Neoconidiobolus thromboides FSU 785]|nr:bifunctional ornithine acetyltransferase/N-acetylglutamate synthase protein [Neoconidiobolus thromboides FSU 785]